MCAPSVTYKVRDMLQQSAQRGLLASVSAGPQWAKELWVLRNALYTKQHLISPEARWDHFLLSLPFFAFWHMPGVQTGQLWDCSVEPSILSLPIKLADQESWENKQCSPQKMTVR